MPVDIFIKMFISKFEKRKTTKKNKNWNKLSDATSSPPHPFFTRWKGEDKTKTIIYVFLKMYIQISRTCPCVYVSVNIFVQ